MQAYNEQRCHWSYLSPFWGPNKCAMYCAVQRNFATPTAYNGGGFPFEQIRNNSVGVSKYLHVCWVCEQRVSACKTAAKEQQPSSQLVSRTLLNLIDACIVLIVSRLPSPTSSLAFAASTGRGAGNVRCVGAVPPSASTLITFSSNANRRRGRQTDWQPERQSQSSSWCWCCSCLWCWGRCMA